MENQILPALDIALNLLLQDGGVHTRKRSTIGFNAKGYFALDSAQNKNIDTSRNMRDLDNLKTCREFHGSMDISTTRRMATPFYSHTRRNYEQLVHRT
jgi:hypothetical protein